MSLCTDYLTAYSMCRNSFTAQQIMLLQGSKPERAEAKESLSESYLTAYAICRDSLKAQKIMQYQDKIRKGREQ